MKVPTICRTQLNNRGNDFPFNDPQTEKKDCNVAVTSEGLELFNGIKLTAHDTRAQGGYPGAVPTGNNLTNKVFTANGLVKGQDYLLAKPRAFADLKTALRAGWFVGLYVDYGVLNAEGGVTGDKKYTGVHCVGVWGWRRKHGILVWDHDPLFDGRRPAIPYGRQHVPFGPLRKAAESAVVRQRLSKDDTNLWSGWAIKIPLK